MGDTNIELICSNNGEPSVFNEVLERRGEGLRQPQHDGRRHEGSEFKLGGWRSQAAISGNVTINEHSIFYSLSCSPFSRATSDQMESFDRIKLLAQTKN